MPIETIQLAARRMRRVFMKAPFPSALPSACVRVNDVTEDSLASSCAVTQANFSRTKIVGPRCETGPPQQRFQLRHEPASRQHLVDVRVARTADGVRVDVRDESDDFSAGPLLPFHGGVERA